MNIEIAFKHQPTTFFGKLVQLFTGNPIHCEVLFPDGTMISATEGIGVYEHTWSDIDHERTNWSFIRVPIKNGMDWMELRERLRMELGCKYDILGALVGWWWGRETPNKWFCSEFCAFTLTLIGHILHRGNNGRYTPARLFREIKLTSIKLVR